MQIQKPDRFEYIIIGIVLGLILAFTILALAKPAHARTYQRVCSCVEWQYQNGFCKLGQRYYDCGSTRNAKVVQRAIAAGRLQSRSRHPGRLR